MVIRGISSGGSESKCSGGCSGGCSGTDCGGWSSRIVHRDAFSLFASLFDDIRAAEFLLVFAIDTVATVNSQAASALLAALLC